MTTSSSSNKYRINIGQIKDKDSIVLINQIKTISTKRLTEKITILEDELFRQIKKKIRKFF